jgi:cellulose synthase/poly-beta-1,6-N-acetylglucosamine synthase-like glycosyltransferase
VISILIPVYNYDVRPLVSRLHHQVSNALVPVEIICMDDCSDPKYKKLNAELDSFTDLKFIRLNKNIGRSAIRNRLAEIASYEYLLFMDCDSMPETDVFIFDYAAFLAPDKVLYGGRTYIAEKPFKKELFFHWFYGSNREVKTAEQRSVNPYSSFMTNNFVIPKKIMLEIGFDESLKQYGHEDTVFGLELKKRGVPIHHLNNPLRHTGLETASVFLRKSEQAIENLLMLMQKHELQAEIKLLRFFVKTRKWGLHPFIYLWFYLFSSFLKARLLGANPNLRTFDLYKLGYMVYNRHKLKQSAQH